MNIKAAYHYVLSNICRSIIVYYIILIVFYSLIFSSIAINTSGNTQYNNNINGVESYSVSSSGFSGMEFITVIFIFIMGYYALRNNFGTLIQNSLSRKSIFVNECLVSLTFALIMSTINELILIISKLAATAASTPRHTIEVSSLAESVYHMDITGIGGILFHLTNYLYTFFLFLFTMMVGYLLSLIYYRVNRAIKILLNVSFLSVVVLYRPIVIKISNERLKEAVSDFLNSIFGITTNQPAFAMITYLILSAIASYFIWLLLRRANVREY